MIRIDNLTKNYGKRIAINNLTLNIEEGSLFGLLGVNGAGKTTLIKSMCGLCVFQEGEIYIDGKSVKHAMSDIKRIINISPQETAIAPNLTVKENLSFFAEIYDSLNENYIKEIIQKMRLEDVLEQKAKTLSGGYMRRLSIAISLISHPKVLFLDEPTLGLDVFARKELWEIIKELQGKMTIVLTSHYMEEIEALCDDVAIISKGKLLFQGTVSEAKTATGEERFEDAFMKIVGESEER